MDYFEGVVAEFIRADRACFINPGFCLQNDLAPLEADRKRHWYVDILAFHMRHQCAYLCEVTYAKKPAALIKPTHRDVDEGYNGPLSEHGAVRDQTCGCFACYC